MRRLGNLPATPNEYQVPTLPITIAMSEVGDFQSGHTWYLSVNSSGDAVVEIRKPGESVKQPYQATTQQVTSLRELLIAEKFFDFDDDYGDKVPDGSTQTLTIAVGDYEKTVRVHFLMNWVNQFGNRGPLLEAARALRVWLAARNWFQHADAVDTRSYDQRILNAIGP